MIMKKQFFEFLKKCFLAGLFFALLSMNSAIGQETISGTVTDNLGPVVGANVLVKGSTNGSQTDFDGNFSIQASPNDVLVISYIGYASQSIKVGNQKTINVVLAEDASLLDEVVVIGYGTSKKSDLTGAVSQVTAKSFENQPLTRVEDALQGRAAGVSVSGSGAPGAGIKVRVRGVNSITGNNDPLVVVDGVFGGDLRTINPNDIASIEVLKDASSLAIYGSRASNGVILVTTKKGAGKPKISFDHFVSISSQARSIETLGSGDFARQKNAGLIANGADPAYTEQQISALDANPLNYEDQLFQTGIGTNTQLAVSGGKDNLRYFVSGNYVNQTGTVIGNEYERFSLRSNINLDVTEKLSVGVNLYGSRESEVNNPDDFNRFKGSSILKTLTWDPTLPVQDSDGNFITSSNFANNGFNPIGTLLRSNRDRAADRLNTTINVGYKFTDHFKYSLVVGASTINQNIESFIRDDNPSDANPNHTRVAYTNFRNTSHQVSNILNYNNSFNKHNLDITGVYEFQGDRNTFNGYDTFAIATGSIYLADNEDQSRENFTNDGNQNAIQSYLGRVQYNYNNSLYLTGSMRIDESSRFAKGNRTGYFPSGAIAYSFNNMPFIENGKTLSSLKFRAGWGQVGNQNINSTARFSLTNDAGNYPFDGSTLVSGSTLIQVGNPNLTWETTSQTNIGVDMGFFSGRLNASVDYFSKTTEDLLLRTIIPGTSFAKFENAGVVENQGIDLTLSGTIVQNDNFTWDSSFNLSHVKNEVTELVNDVDQILGNIRPVDGTENSINVIELGQPLGQFYGLTFLGTWKSTDDLPDGIQAGDAKYLTDDEGNSVFSTIGNGLPTLTWGFNNTFNYKNLSLNVFINAAHNFDVYNQVAAAINGGAGDFRDDLSPLSVNKWTPQNETELPRRGSLNVLNSSRYVEDGSFVRLSNLKLGYTFDDVIKNVESLQIYVSGQNLVLLTDYSGYDPEVSSTPVNQDLNNTDAGAGIDIGAYPNPRTFTLGLKLQF